MTNVSVGLASVAAIPAHLFGHSAGIQSRADIPRTASTPSPTAPSSLRLISQTALAAGHPAFDPERFLTTAGIGRGTGRYLAGAAIFQQGDVADAVFFIKSGKVQITIVSLQGKEGVIAVHGAGQFFGEGCLAGQALTIATAMATEDSEVVKIDKRTMIHALRDEPALSQMFVSFLLSRNIQVEADLADHLFNSSEKRLARVLLLLASFERDTKVSTIPNISQEALASRVGTTRSRINLFMNKFRSLGFIAYDAGTLSIHSSLRSVVAQG